MTAFLLKSYAKLVFKAVINALFVALIGGGVFWFVMRLIGYTPSFFTCARWCYVLYFALEVGASTMGIVALLWRSHSFAKRWEVPMSQVFMDFVERDLHKQRGYETWDKEEYTRWSTAKEIASVLMTVINRALVNR